MFSKWVIGVAVTMDPLSVINSVSPSPILIYSKVFSAILLNVLPDNTKIEPDAIIKLFCKLAAKKDKIIPTIRSRWIVTPQSLP
jgi:hypothetical protein